MRRSPLSVAALFGLVPLALAAGTAKPIPVRLGAHKFGHIRAPEAVVARAGPSQVYFPPAGESCCGPVSFEVGSDGSVWLLDGGNQRLLVWEQGRPGSLPRVVALPFFCCEDFALGRGGALYVTQSGTPEHPLNFLYRLTRTGEVVWKGTLAAAGYPIRLRIGPDGTLYSVTKTWQPATTPDGRPLSVAEQRRRATLGEPVAGGRRFVATVRAPHEVRYALINRAGRVLRSWRVVSRTRIEVALDATPTLVDGDPVVVLVVSKERPKFRWEYLILRLGRKGAHSRLTLSHDPPRAAWGDIVTSVRTGPGGKIYQLGSSPSTGITVSRY